MRRPLVYISGPISNGDALVLYANVNRFFAVEILLLRSGYAVLNPANDYISCVMAGDMTWEELMDKDETFISVADAVYQLDGWENSRGALEEFAAANKYAVPCAGSLSDLEEIFYGWEYPLERPPSGLKEPDWVERLPHNPDD